MIFYQLLGKPQKVKPQNAKNAFGRWMGHYDHLMFNEHTFYTFEYL